MLGMISFGAIADLIGVNNAGILTALLSLMGVIVMTFMTSEDLTTQFLVYAIFFGIFGLGVGGEYPLTAAGAAAHHSDTVEEAALDNSDERRVRVSVRINKAFPPRQTIPSIASIAIHLRP